MHPVNSNDAENIYKVFAESQRGPMILLYKNAVCTQFHIEPKYSDTVTLLQNFVKHMSEKIYTEHQRMDIPLGSVVLISTGKAAMPSPVAGPRASVTSGHHTIVQSVVKHSGYAFSKRGGPVLVMNNATSGAAIKVIRDDSRESDTSSDESSYSFTMHGRRRSIRASDPKAAKRPGRPIQHKATSSLGANPPLSGTDWATVTWSQQEIREFLHPGYPVEIMRNRPKTKGLLRTAVSPGAKPGVKFKFTPFSYCRYKEFAQPEATLRCTTSMGTIRADGTPFIESERALLKEQNRNKEKWLIGKGFQTVFRPVSRSEVKSPLVTEPLSPPSRHQFREEVRSKWRAGDFKK